MATEKQLSDARKYAAEIDRRIAESCLQDGYGFAAHVTGEQKIKYRDSHLRLAEEIESGQHDGSFTVWQRMNYFLTGETVPFLP